MIEIEKCMGVETYFVKGNVEDDDFISEIVKQYDPAMLVGEVQHGRLRFAYDFQERERCIIRAGENKRGSFEATWIGEIY